MEHLTRPVGPGAWRATIPVRRNLTQSDPFRAQKIDAVERIMQVFPLHSNRFIR